VTIEVIHPEHGGYAAVWRLRLRLSGLAATAAVKQLADGSGLVRSSSRERQFVVTESAGNDTNLSQRSIYDVRYSVGSYDESRSAVPVLTAEREAMRGAVRRALTSHPYARQISIFDFGYGTGRVVNDWIEHHARAQLPAHDLRVVAYDVSSVGLQQAHHKLCSAGYEPVEPPTWDPKASRGYIAGSVSKQDPGGSITVVFVHGCEDQPPRIMRDLALAANRGNPYLLTTSWYSGLGHVPGDGLRREYFRQLSELTSPLGEVILCLSSTGDLVEEQPKWTQRLAAGDTGGFPVERTGDVVYQTELGQDNFYHIFNPELNDYMAAITSDDQHWWIEGIRCPDEEFESQDEEQANYHRVRQANGGKRGRVWNADDYREFHTVAAFRSPVAPLRDA
jgi:hypothetical protein